LPHGKKKTASLSLTEDPVKKKIALITSNYGAKGGLEKYLGRIGEELLHRGHDVTLLTAGESVPASPFQVVLLKKRGKLSLLHLLEFDRCAKNYCSLHHFDAIFGFDRHFLILSHYRAGNGCHAAYLDHRKLNCSFFKRLSFSFNPLHRLILKMEKETFENPKLQCLFTNSYLVRDEILNYYPRVLPEKIRVVHNGVAWHERRASFEETFTKGAEIKKRLGLSDCFQFLFVGHEWKRKGLELLLRSLSLLRKENFQLSCVGRERKRDYFSALAKECGIENKVLFFPPCADVTPFFQAADCAVIPSYYDPFANVTTEALAMGLYVITSPTNGGKEVLTSSSGTVFSSFDEETLAACLKERLAFPKTQEVAIPIRNSVKSLDFSSQIEKITSCFE
jgi:UDP-glucose:(heptosyl)LPS alpha-1,3-glucosyltransferase